MNTPQIQLVVARPENGLLIVSAVIDGKTHVLQMAPHVAASAISALSEALSNLSLTAR